MYHIENTDREVLWNCDTLSEAKQLAEQKLNRTLKYELFFDGDPDLGADEIVIYPNQEIEGYEEKILGYITWDKEEEEDA